MANPAAQTPFRNHQAPLPMRPMHSITGPLLLASAGLAAQAPLHHWPLDQAMGDLVLSATGAAPGSVQGNFEWLPNGGRHHGGLRLNGNTARADLGPCDIITGATESFTAAVWARPEVMAGTERILFAKATAAGTFAWSISLVNSTGARARIRAGGTEYVAEMPPSSIYTNAWYHFALTYDGAMLRLYLNGSLVAFTAASGVFTFDGAAPVTLGNLIDNGRPFYGVVDDPRIYDVALDPQQVVDLVIGQVPMGVPDTHPLRLASVGPAYDMAGRSVPLRGAAAGSGTAQGIYEGGRRRIVLDR